jgi:hypothetical protein
MNFTNGEKLRFEIDGDRIKIGKGTEPHMTKFEALCFINRLKEMIEE